MARCVSCERHFEVPADSVLGLADLLDQQWDGMSATGDPAQVVVRGRRYLRKPVGVLILSLPLSLFFLNAFMQQSIGTDLNSLLGLLFAFGCFWATWEGIAGVVNKRTLTITPGRVVVEEGPLPRYLKNEVGVATTGGPGVRVVKERREFGKREYIDFWCVISRNRRSRLEMIDEFHDPKGAYWLAHIIRIVNQAGKDAPQA